MRETSFFESRFFQSVSYSANDGGKKEEVSAESKPTVYGRVPAGRNCTAFAADSAAKAVRPALFCVRSFVLRPCRRGLCASLPPPFAKGGQTRFVQECGQNGTFDKPQFCRAVMPFGTCLRCDVCRAQAECAFFPQSPRRLRNRRGGCVSRRVIFRYPRLCGGLFRRKAKGARRFFVLCNNIAVIY